MIGMGVVEADNVQTAFSSLALNADQFLGRDVIAVMGGIGARIARAYGHLYLVDSVERMTEQHTATLMGIGLFTVLAQFAVHRIADTERQLLLLLHTLSRTAHHCSQ